MGRIEVSSNGSPQIRRSMLELQAVRPPLLAPAKNHPCSACMPLFTLPCLWLRGWQKSFPAQHLRSAAHSAWNSDIGRRESGTRRSNAQTLRAPGSTQDWICSGNTAGSCNIGDLTSCQASQRGQRLRKLLTTHLAAQVHPYNWPGRRGRRLHLRGLGASPCHWPMAAAFWKAPPIRWRTPLRHCVAALGRTTPVLAEWRAWGSLPRVRATPDGSLA